MNRRERAAWNAKIDAAKTPKEQQKLIQQYAEQQAADDIARINEGKKFDNSGGTKKVRGGDGPATAAGPFRTSTRGDYN